LLYPGSAPLLRNRLPQRVQNEDHAEDRTKHHSCEHARCTTAQRFMKPHTEYLVSLAVPE
jgi:hypothetical protein